MKIALVHDYIKEYGGAERVLETLHEIWPRAPIFTTVYLPNFLGPHQARLASWDIRPSILQLIPFKDKLISPLRLLAPFVFKSLDLVNFDVVIVSATGAYTPNLINKKSGAVHICYCHTPPRYLYGYATAREWKKYPVLREAAEIANHFLRLVDFTSAQKPDFFVANSCEVAGRIKKFYRRDATVIYPPVELVGDKELVAGNKEGNYYLTGGRLARSKGIHLAVAACTKLKIPLKVFGKEFAGYGEELRKIAGPTVKFLGEVTDEEKFKLMAGAKAFIFPSPDEDFGITPVEAMLAGTPVIAFRAGGVVESVVEGKTGVFFNDCSVDALVSTLKRFDRRKFNSEIIKKHAQKFSKERFKKEIKEFVEKVVK